MRSTAVKVLLIPLFLALLGGCAEFIGTGPTAETPLQRAMAARAAAVERARTSLQTARAEGCENTAPFEYYMAQEYLRLAEHELAGGDKEGVVAFADKSNVHSMRALEMAKGEKK